jgi:4-hydroxy-2-oxoglutarate aldolase
MKKPTGIIAPLCTPFLDDKILYDGLAANVARYGESGLSGLFVLGSNGEASALSEAERQDVLRTAVSARSSNLAIYAGCGRESTHYTIEEVERAATLGADFACIVSPSYYRKYLTDRALIEHFCAIADASPIPVVIYNAPGFTALKVSSEVIMETRAHPNIAGLKDTTQENLCRYPQWTEGDFCVLAGTVSTLYPAMLLGASGGVVSLGNVFPDLCCRLYAAAVGGESEIARDLHARLSMANANISGRFGIAGTKRAMDLVGYTGGSPRSPIGRLSSADVSRIEETVRDLASVCSAYVSSRRQATLSRE